MRMRCSPAASRNSRYGSPARSARIRACSSAGATPCGSIGDGATISPGRDRELAASSFPSSRAWVRCDRCGGDVSLGRRSRVDLADYSACDGIELRRLLEAREITPDELRDAALRAIEAVEPRLNAVVSGPYEDAVAAPDGGARRRAAGGQGHARGGRP